MAPRGQASEPPISPSSNRFDNEDYEDPLRLNKPGTFKASARPKAPAGPLQALLSTPQDLGAKQYSKQNLDRIIQTFLHASKDESSKDKLKAKTPNVYRDRFHIECYNFF